MAMSESARERANHKQLSASDPAVSAFVAASAGSGKTKLLTDRLLRLMLAGAPPERIQCLTFTKAAAAEMSLRLQRTLGRWVTLSPPDLAQALSRLQVEPTDDACHAARALFAKVLDLPGGMRIGTIHAFSQSLLRRFPLEAEISPHFQLVDDRDADDALSEAREDVLAQASSPAMLEALTTLAGLASAEQFGQHVKALQGDRGRLDAALALGEDLAAAQRRALGVKATREVDVLTDAVHWLGETALREAAKHVQARGARQVADKAAAILHWLSRPTRHRRENWSEWRDIFLCDGVCRGETALVNKALSFKEPALLHRYLEEADRIIAVEERLRALRLAAVSHGLATLAGPVAIGYAQRKDEAGLLDYNDLIDRTSALLLDPGAAWVLYKLDGGLDHLLLDEVQDTAPQQWRIAHALTLEFFSGAGSRDNQRTVFAVGDRKQSIYSFQGADADEFDRSHDMLARRVRNAGQRWLDAELDVSFRSTAPVLALVDAVFADPLAAPGVVAAGESLTHYADRSGHAGLVELWPLAPMPEPATHTPWTIPEQNQALTSAPQLLADALADWIRAQTDGSVLLESRGRALAAGDVLVLVRRRGDFARALVRALKTHGVPVAGLDRLVLTEQPAVQDLMALADALLLPSDDLTFACMLTSPLGGLTDEELAELAIARTGSLWETLRDRASHRSSWRRAADFFVHLLGRVDYVTPFVLFAEALGRLGGRARLLQRLGPEAAEPVDELLNAALTYAGLHPPSLQGFLHWLRRSGAEVKREPEAAGNLVRVMTVHGAKGLQAPLVIVPDTTALPRDEAPLLWADDPATGRAVPLWAPRKEFRCAALDKLREADRRRQIEEYNRLLYVALTRAEDRLLVCGWQTKQAPKDICWYSRVASGFNALQAERQPFARWTGDLLRLQSPQQDTAEQAGPMATAVSTVMLPSWIGAAPDWIAAPPPPEPPRPTPLAPSRPEGVDLGSVPEADSPLADRVGAGNRFRRGQLVHALLQHLPSVPRTTWQQAAMRFLARPGHGMADGQAEQMAAEVLAVMSHPDLSALFGPAGRAEVPLTGLVGQSVVGGLVDRLAVMPDRVLVADYKTNRRPPVTVEDTPVLYLRQMASYRAVLRSVFPDRPVRCALIWTRQTHVAILPDELLDRHEPGLALIAT